jgi:hypothetical protein
MRGDYEAAAEHLTRAAEAFGNYGRETSRWYEWSVRVITARLANRRGRPEEAFTLADAIIDAEGAPPAERLDAELIAAEALVLSKRPEGSRRAPARRSKAASTRARRPARGASSCACAACCTRRKAAPTRRTTTSRRA